MRRDRNWLASLAALLALLAVLPVLAIVSRGIAPGAGATWSHLAATVLPTYVANTLGLIVLVGTGIVAGGTAAGWLVARTRFPGSGLFEWALLLPLAMPAYVAAYAYTDFLQYAGPVQSMLRAAFGWSHGDYWFPDVRSLPGAATMFVFVLYPYVYLLARTAFLEHPPALVEAARTLGLDRREAFWRVELPLARPAIAGGIALALMETLADYGTVAYFAVDTFTTGIYRAWFSLGDRGAAAQLAATLLLFVVAAVVLEKASRGRRRTSVSGRGRQASHYARRRLTGPQGWLATLICAIPLLVGFVIPLLLLLRLLRSEADVVLSARFVEWTWNSLRVASLAALLAVLLATLVAYAVRLTRGPLPRLGSNVLTLGYAVPGTVLAVGVLLPLGAADNWIASTVHALTGRNPGLLLTGTVFALVYAYLVRYFAVAWNGIEPGFARITPAMDDAARSLGAGMWGTLARVHAPLLARSAAAALLLVFVDVMKELPATLVLRPFNFDTLATQTFMLAKDERLAEAALPSLAIVAVGIVPIIALARMARRGLATGDAPVAILPVRGEASA
ncbi:MAG TPA: iron ABC transporter permease [Casimicrobiaceae bacterium]